MLETTMTKTGMNVKVKPEAKFITREGKESDEQSVS